MHGNGKPAKTAGAPDMITHKVATTLDAGDNIAAMASMKTTKKIFKLLDGLSNFLGSAGMIFSFITMFLPQGKYCIVETGGGASWLRLRSVHCQIPVEVIIALCVLVAI